MKREIGAVKPDSLKEEWPGQWSVFSHYEQMACVPGALYVVTTKKESGQTNAGWFSSAAFHGDGGGHFAILPGIMQSSHTYQNILREMEFVVNYLSPAYDAHCRKTIGKTGDDVDELEVAGLSVEASAVISAPRIREAFLSFECKLESVADLSDQGMNALVIGRVVNACVEENHHGIERICNDFTYNVRAMDDNGETNSFAQLKAYH